MPPSGSSTSAGAGDLAQRVARLEKLVKAGGNADWAIDRTGGVTHQELAEAIDRATARIHSQVDRKFEVQSLSIESLRAMMRQTDQLLEKVLAGLDAAAEREAEAE